MRALETNGRPGLLSARFGRTVYFDPKPLAPQPAPPGEKKKKNPPKTRMRFLTFTNNFSTSLVRGKLWSECFAFFTSLTKGRDAHCLRLKGDGGSCRPLCGGEARHRGRKGSPEGGGGDPRPRTAPHSPAEASPCKGGHSRDAQTDVQELLAVHILFFIIIIIIVL